MSKKLSYKILAAVLALNVFNLINVAPAWAADDISGDDTDKSITISEGDSYNVVFGTGSYNTTGDVSGGKVTVTGGNVIGVIGGFTCSGNATDNIVEISGGNFSTLNAVIGGYTYSGSANDNKVIISGGNFENIQIVGGYSSSSSDRNEVIISGGTFEKTNLIFATYGGNDNKITITGNAGGSNHDLSNVRLYGQLTSGTGDNNSLVLNGWSGSAKAAKSFDTISFENVKWDTTTPVLTLTNASQNDLANTQIDIVSFDKNTEIKPGESMTFVKSSNDVNLGVTSEQINVRKTALQGVAKEITGIMKSADGKTYTFTIEKIGVNPQTNLLTQTNAAAAAFVNQGTDLINDSLDVIGRDGRYGIKTFAAVQGNRSKYNVADDLKINGWSVLAGVGNENPHKGGDFAWGVFYENGSGNYRTYNHFNNEFFRGDGSMVYNGGGIALRYKNSHGVYTEGSLRAGTLKNEMDNALRDASGASYGCDTESTYYGAHIGVGQIFEIDENTDLDVYGKFFHTYTDGDSVTIAGDKFDFDSVTSDRLRVGARVTKQQAKVNTYYGLAYEYEFNGDADMTAQGIKAPTESFGGGSGLAELGFNYQPGNDSPWNFDLNLRGYVGERQGGSFNVQATYTF